MVTDRTKQSTADADKTNKMAERLEAKLNACLDLGTRMEDLEALVADYCAKINSMDTGIAELNAHLSDFQSDIKDMIMRQKDLRNTQNSIALDFEALWKQIELLRDIKADREEVADALRDKVGLGALNGIVSLQQFDAVRGDIEKQIATAYDKFNSQETIWQKIIDDLLRELNEKTDWIQVISLKEDINKHLDNFRCRLNTMMEVVGEPKAAAVAKKLHRDLACLCCSTPTDMLLEEHVILPVLPAMRQPTKGAEARMLKGDGDHGPCYPGHPIPHPRDPRISVVTQEDFEKLAATVRQLQQKFGPDGNASLPENAHLMKEMRKDASLTDAMAALQLSGRLEDSEKKLEKMLAIVELLSKKVIGKGITAIAALNAHFSNLQSDVEDTMMRQKDLKNTLNALALDFEALRKQIEILRDIKADREEVADALRDKVGLGALNGLVSLQQFDAVRGDIEKKIATAYDKNILLTYFFINQQKIIDDLLRELNEKTDWIHVVSLREDINKHLDNFRCRLNTMMEIIGEPRAAAVAKKLHRDAACLCCSTPADMLLEEHKVLPVLPAMIQPTKGSDARKPKEDGDHGPCYPGHPIPHPRDPRTHVCKRWCGGSHTVISHTVSRAPVGMLIKQTLSQWILKTTFRHR
ncbi:Uncharacterized protein OBRU01_14007 [Operophtera brumata]|uniref:DUF4795 domain-containing protein n=1 Tax=Operophtera brumata TaxID=104452 RepID=A0A0L7L137_OPEBR|nr:Uncharacterized protein OBRU01_14007 [Operophtera brumata]